MFQIDYVDFQNDALLTARRREHEVMDRCLELLDQALEQGPTSMAAIEAMHFTIRFWSVLLEDLASPDNELPPEIRASVISIGIWVLKECDNIRRGESENIQGVRDIVGTIAGGLS